MNVNLPDNVPYLETFTFKLAKHKMTNKMLEKPHIFYSLSQINAQYGVSARFVTVNFFLVSLERNYFSLTFRFKTSAVFLCIYCDYKHTANYKHLDDNMTY